MSIFDTFAKRKRRSEDAGRPVIYRYDVLPNQFRVQVVYIWRSAIGEPYYYPSIPMSVWERIRDTLAREMGKLRLVESTLHSSNPMEHCVQFLLASKDVDQVLSLIEISFLEIDTTMKEVYQYGGNLNGSDVSQTPDDAIKELNFRFQEHAIGYQYEAGRIIKMDSQYMHAEVVEPAIRLLHEAKFEGALQEFMNAHKHYRERNNKEAITEALKAFESTMKTICDRRKLGYSQNDTASKLIKTLFDNHIVPVEMESQFNSLRSTLESGVPTLRNKKGGHGQGSEPMEVPDYIAAYALHLTASNIVFLINAHNS